LIRHDSDAPSIQPRESDDDVLGVVLLHFKEVSVVDHRVNHVFDVIGLVRQRWNHRVERSIGPIGRIGTRPPRRVIQIVRRHKTQQLAHH
jgi:hypothetical protein